MSDELGMLAHPRPALSGSGDALVETIATLVHEEGIAEVVVGLPLSLSGGDSAQTRHARKLIARLRQGLPVPVREWDERLTSVQAGRTISSRDRASGRRDSAAAALLLQSVIDSRRVRS